MADTNIVGDRSCHYACSDGVGPDKKERGVNCSLTDLVWAGSNGVVQLKQHQEISPCGYDNCLQCPFKLFADGQRYLELGRKAG